MARNPIYPTTPGETAVDRLLNQTLPQLIAQGQENKRREQELEYRRLQDIQAQDNFEANLTLRTQQIDEQRVKDQKDEVRRKLTLAKGAEQDGDFDVAYDFYMDAEELADKYALTDEFQPTIDRAMSTGAKKSAANNEFDRVYADLKTGDQKTFNTAYDKYNKMLSEGRVTDSMERRVNSLQTLESKKLENRFSIYGGSDVLGLYQDFNKKYNLDVFNKVGMANNVKDMATFKTSADMAGQSVEQYYKETFGVADKSRAEQFLRNEITGNPEFTRLYNGSSDQMKQALNQTIINTYRIANEDSIREAIKGQGIKESDPTFENRVAQAIRNNALSSATIPGLKIKFDSTPLKAEDAPTPIESDPAAFGIKPKKKQQKKKKEKTNQELSDELNKLKDRGYSNLSREEQERYKELQSGEKSRQSQEKADKTFQFRKNKLDKRIENNERLIKNYQTVLKDGRTYTAQRMSGPVTAYSSVPGSDFIVRNKTADEIMEIINSLKFQINKDKKAIESGFIRMSQL